MKKLFRDFLILVANVVWFTGVFYLCSCNRRTVQTTTEHHTKDSTVFTKERITDTLLLKPDTLWQTKTDTLTKIQIRYRQEKGGLQLQAKCPPDTLKVQNHHYHTHTKETKTKEIPRVPWYTWLLIYMLAIANFIQLFRK